MKRAAPDPSTLAAVVARLAVLLEAGIAPSAAWMYVDQTLTRAGTASPGRVSAAVQLGESVQDAIGGFADDQPVGERDAWRALAVAWAVATESGAPLAATLRQFAVTLRDFAEAQREIAIALAAPTLTARLVLALPLVGVFLGMPLGFDTLRVLFATPGGWLCLGTGGALQVAASRWNRHLVDRAQPSEHTPGLAYDLVAIAVSGGAALDHALRSVVSIAKRFDLATAFDDPRLVAVLELSQRAGVPAAALLRGEAQECRREALAAAHADARALGVRLMVTLGACVLPAFLVVSVLPLLLAVWAQTRLND